MRKSVFFQFVLAFTLLQGIYGQNHFKVDLSNRAPDVKSLVMSYEGTKSIPFQAKDVNGVEHSLMAMKGKTVMLWFWTNDCVKCLEQIDALNLLSEKYAHNLQVISFSSNTKEEINNLLATTPVNFPIIPNSKILSEGPYGGDLGYPKIFIIDQQGMIKWVLPEMEMRNNFNAYSFLESLHTSLHH